MSKEKSEVGGQRSEVGATSLKPCPFCGGENTLLIPPGQIHCLSCGANGPHLKVTRMEARYAWNQRVPRERDEFALIILRLKQRGMITQADVDRLERDGMKEVSHGG